MFVDSYDVIFTGGKGDILTKFFTFEADAVFSAEGFCWPDATLKDKYPESEGKKYLNSGELSTMSGFPSAEYLSFPFLVQSDV